MRRCSISRRYRCGWRITAELKRLFDALATAGRHGSARLSEGGCGTGCRPARIAIRVIKVNRKTLSLFEANDLPHLVANLGQIFRNDMLDTHIGELVQLWEGEPEFSERHRQLYAHGPAARHPAARTDSAGIGRQTWDRVLVAIEDVTERETARRKLALSEEYAQGLFEHSPISLWVEDFSAIKRLLDEVRQQGIRDFRVFTDVHPEFVDRCMSEIRVIDVNQHTLDLFHAPDKPTLLRRLRDIFRDDMRPHFREQLVDLWDGKIFQQREVLNYSLDGEEVHVQLQFSVLPGMSRIGRWCRWR